METNRTIMVVDDEPDMLDLLVQLLSHHVPGSAIVGAPDGAHAIEGLSRTQVAILVTDYRMPGMNGLQLAAKVRRMAPNVRIVLMTAYADSALRAMALKEHQVDVAFKKPVSPEELARAVRLLLGP